MSLNWFPKPAKIDDIFILEAGKRNLSESFVFELFNSSDAKELKEKVGVSVLHDGSAKSSTRLLLNKGFIFKTDISHGESDFDILNRKVSKQISVAGLLKVYHPDKCWFIYKSGDSFYPCTICPELITLHGVGTWEKKSELFIELIRISINSIKSHGLELDLNPSNFGFEDGKEQIYYIDDEVYKNGDLRSLGEFMIHRIKTENQVTEEQWEDFGEKAKKLLKQYLSTYSDMNTVIHGIEESPLTQMFSTKRNALLKAFLKMDNPEKDLKKPIIENLITKNSILESPVKITGELSKVDNLKTPVIHYEYKNETEQLIKKEVVCIMADIHANLPALESVISEAKKLGANKFFILGDIVGYGPFPKETIEFVANLPDTLIIQGNHDYSIANDELQMYVSRLGKASSEWTSKQLNQQELDWLNSLKPCYTFEDYMLVHGSVIDPKYFYSYIYEMTYEANLKKTFDLGYNFVFYGHTHVPYIYFYLHEKDLFFKQQPSNIQLYQEGKTFLINPGSVGQPRDQNNKASFCIWDCSSNVLSFHRTDYEMEKTIRALEMSELPNDLISRLRNGT